MTLTPQQMFTLTMWAIAAFIFAMTAIPAISDHQRRGMQFLSGLLALMGLWFKI